MDLYGAHYENIEKLLALRKQYTNDPNNLSKVYPYVRELNRQRRYRLASEIASSTQARSGGDPKLSRLLEYQNDYALRKIKVND